MRKALLKSLILFLVLIFPSFQNSTIPKSFNLHFIQLSNTHSDQWAMVFGESGDEEFWSVQQTSDGSYVIAGSTDPFGPRPWDFWVIKLDQKGKIQWEKTYGLESTSEMAYSIQKTNDGGFVLAGVINGLGNDIDEKGSDILVIKLDENGNILWENAYGALGWDWPGYTDSIQQTTDGGYIVTGYTSTWEGAVKIF
ncbi:hypothetical protein ACFLT2_03320 [Acidobacteriota bacterium]